MDNYIDELIKDIDSTHHKLGDLIALCAICVKAHKFVLLVSPSGCGKSTAMDYVSKYTPDSWMPTQLSIASLVNKTDKLTSFRSVIGIDDIATIQTDYARRSTITTLSALCYSHRVEPSMVGFDFCIEDFYGSALVGIQPSIIKDMMIAPEWEASIKDKSLRYYHLYRPLMPSIGIPVVKLKYGNIDIEDVNFEPDAKNKLWMELYQLGLLQWSRARSKQHMTDLVKSVATFDNRKDVVDSDIKLLIRLLRPMAIETMSINKNQLEGDRIFDNNLVSLLAEYYTYGGEFSLAHIAQDFSLRIAQTYRIMQHQNGNWQQISKSPTIYRPSKHLMEELKELGLEIKKEKGSKKNE